MLPPRFVNALALLVDVQDAVELVNRELGCGSECSTEPWIHACEDHFNSNECNQMCRTYDAGEWGTFDLTTLQGYCTCR